VILGKKYLKPSLTSRDRRDLKEKRNIRVGVREGKVYACRYVKKQEKQEKINWKTTYHYHDLESTTPRLKHAVHDICKSGKKYF
jgi:hypothetical protein